MASKISDKGLSTAIRREMAGGCRIIPADGDAVAIIGREWRLYAASVELLPDKTAALLRGAAGRLCDAPVTIYSKEPPQTILPETASETIARAFDDVGDLVKVQDLQLHHQGRTLLKTERGEVYAYDPALLRIVNAGYNGDMLAATAHKGLLVYVEYGIEVRIAPETTAIEDIPLYAALAKIDW